MEIQYLYFFSEIINNPDENISEQYFARALYGCSIGLINNILNNISWSRAMYLCEELLRIDSSEETADSSKYVLTAQKNVLEAIEKLEKQDKFVQ